MLNTQDFIRLKRDQLPLPQEAINAFIQGVSRETVSDAQIAAFCMATLLNGLPVEETAHLTQAMVQSGVQLSWPDLKDPVIDKHSTGGIGDKTSLMLAPIAAACGLYVPMIAGRGLGHTGGTIDKLEAIPGYKTSLSLDHFQNIVREIGCSIIGQTNQLAPADKRMYVVRDVTGTVESIPLITASILSKKIAAGLQGLVLDVKFGNGAFMPTREQAQQLADSLKNTGEAAGLKITSVLTDMNQPLGSTAGNAVEIQEAIDYLTGAYREKRLEEITTLLAIEMLLLGQAAESREDATKKIKDVLASGKAAEIFAKMVTAHGGPEDLIDHPQKYLPQAPIQVNVVADRDGTITKIDTRGIGMVLVNLRAGRARAEDSIDPRIGLTHLQPIGTLCEKDKTILACFHLTEEASRDVAVRSYLNCLTIEP